MRRTLAPLAILGLALTGCGETDPVNMACDEFAHYAKAGMPADTRTQTVEDIGIWIDSETPKLRGAYKGLTNNINANEEVWTLSADVFAQTCFDLGWEG